MRLCKHQLIKGLETIMRLNKDHLSRNIWFYYSFLLFLFVFSPSIIYSDFTYHDDIGSYSKLCPITPFLSTIGRPLGDALSCAHYTFLHFFGTTAARGLSVVAIIILQMVMYKFLRRENFPRYLSVFMTFGVIVLPGVLVFASWIAAGYIALALAISISSALLCQQITQQKIKKPIALPYLLLMAAIPELATDFIHQGAAMIFLVFFAIALARAFFQNTASFFRTIWVYSVPFVFANIIYFAYFKLTIAPMLAQRDSSRGVVFENLINRFIWFFKYSLPKGANLWLELNAKGWGAISIISLSIFVICLFGFVFTIIQAHKSQRILVRAIIYLFALIIIMFGCYLPNLVSNMYIDTFRGLFPLSSFFFLMTCTHLWLAFANNKFNPRFILIPVMGLMAVCSYLAMYNQMVMPKYLEFQYLKNLTNQIKVEHKEMLPVLLIRPNTPENAGFVNTDEIGCITTTHERQATTFINYFRSQLNLPMVAITESRYDQEVDRRGKIVIDFSALRTNKLTDDLKKMPPEVKYYPFTQHAKLK